jgi:Flp pilus assembly protein TadD
VLAVAAALWGQEPSLERQAFRAYQERDWAEAARLYEAFHASGGGTSSTYDNLGVALASLGEWNRAEAALFKAIELDPRHRWAYNHLGFVHREQGRLELAAGEFRRQIEISPQDPYAWRNLAGTLVLLGRLEEAEKAAEEHERRGYERGAVYIDMACNLHARRRPEQARRYLELAETLGAERSLLAQEWAHHYLTIGDYRSAEQEYRKLIEYRPYDTPRVLHLAALYYQTGNLEKAAATLAKVI